MNIEHIIVQAGGKGTRLGYLTKNKPKALVPVHNLPLLFHLFKKFPEKRFIIIADYQKEVLREYLECFATVKYQVVNTPPRCDGTCSGIHNALNLLNPQTPFALIWSDLILPDEFILPEADEDYIGISQTFSCRWSYEHGTFTEKNSAKHGVAGFFIFTDKSKLAEVPDRGELVRWLQQKSMYFKELGLAGTKEFGLLEEYNKLETEKCRPFNKIIFQKDHIIKEATNIQGKQLAEKESNWYNAVINRFSFLPAIYNTNPLKMELIQGKNIYEYRNLTYQEKKQLLNTLVGALKQLHSAASIPADRFSIKEIYYRKTIRRLNTIRNLIPFADRQMITINGKPCRNIFFHKRELEDKIDSLSCSSFCFIHGDCTFSNMMLRKNGSPVLIDPRGYFGYTDLYGDELYDWAKLYYSIVGNYDRFNLKDFQLNIEESDISLCIESNHWEDMEQEFFDLTGAPIQDIKLIHAIIWLSLTTYAWQDYDSVCGSFYNGLYYLEDVL